MDPDPGGAAPNRSGRRPRAAAPTPTAQKVRQAREAAHLSMRVTAAQAGFGVECLSDIEYARRLPSSGEWAALSEVLGPDLGPPPEAAPPARPIPRITTGTLLSACQLLVLEGPMAVAEFRRRAGVSEADEEEVLRRLRSRLAAVGVTAVRRGQRVRLQPLTTQQPALVAAAKLSPPERELLTVIRNRGRATRAQLERVVGRRCEWRLRRLSQNGLVTSIADLERTGGPLIYEISDAGRAQLASIEDREGDAVSEHAP